jgi:hypothetical protein
VEPDRHPLEDVSDGLWIGIDRDQIGHLTLGISWLGRGFQSYAILGSHIVAQRNGVSNGVESAVNFELVSVTDGVSPRIRGSAGRRFDFVPETAPAREVDPDCP